MRAARRWLLPKLFIQSCRCFVGAETRCYLCYADILALAEILLVRALREHGTSSSLCDLDAPPKKAKLLARARDLAASVKCGIQPELRKLLVEHVGQVCFYATDEKAIGPAGKKIHYATMMALPLRAPNLRELLVRDDMIVRDDIMMSFVTLGVRALSVRQSAFDPGFAISRVQHKNGIGILLRKVRKELVAF